MNYDFWESSPYGTIFNTFPTVNLNEFCARSFHHKTHDSSHLHDYAQIWYILDGSIRFKIEDSIRVCNQGSLVLLHPFLSHSIKAIGNSTVSCIFINFTETFVAHAPEKIRNSMLLRFIYPKAVHPESTFQTVVPLTLEEQIEARRIFYSFLRIYTENRPDLCSELYNEMNNLINLPSLRLDTKMIEKANENYLDYAKYIQHAINYIKKHYMENLRFSDVCRVSYMSERTFFSIFKRVTGLNFSDYIQHLRISCARRLLIFTDRTVLDIASTCGFKSSAHFNAVFKKITKLTPTQLREKHNHFK